MPIAIVNSVLKQIDKGHTPAVCKKKGVRGRKCAEMVAAMVENKRKARHELRGGTTNRNVVGGFVPAVVEPRAAVGETPVLNEDGSVWLKVMDWNAELINKLTNAPTQISEEAIAASLGAWPSPLYADVMANLDHRPETRMTREEFDFLEGRYAWGDGLYLRVMAADEELRTALLDGTVRPSVEMNLVLDENDDDIVWPTGLGLMWQGEPTSPGAGAAAPPEDALELKGGKTVADNEGGDADSGAVDDKPKKVVVDIAGAENVKAALEAVKLQADRQKAEYEATIAKHKADLDALAAKTKVYEDKEAAADKTRREELLKKLPDDYPNKEASAKELERDIFLFEKAKAEAKSSRAVGPKFTEKDNLSGEFTSEMYEKGKEMERMALHYSPVQAVPPSPFEIGDGFVVKPPVSPKGKGGKDKNET